MQRDLPPLRGRVRVPGDKSISHRALLLGALADGPVRVEGFLPGGDCRATLDCLRALGVQIEQHDETTLTVGGAGLRGLWAPAGPLDCGRSGTTMRLLAGILAGQAFDSVLDGDAQLLRRPMERVAAPLRRMGAQVETKDGHGPLHIQGRPLRGLEYSLPVASAQVKSALLLAGLYADGATTVHQPGPARDHTERLLIAMGAQVQIDGLSVTLQPPPQLRARTIHVPGDLSSAAFLIVAALLRPGSEITIERVGVNPTRTGLLDVLSQMGADVVVQNVYRLGEEPAVDLRVRASALRGVEVGGETVVRMIDEFPVLAVAATQARGRTVVRDAAELRVKESDRIAVTAGELAKLGARIETRADGFVVHGPTPLRGGVVDGRGDHRIAMALAVAGLLAEREVVVKGMERVKDSFPGFEAVLAGMEANQ
ncbi:MAG: 3-phosphoshikimate 1-carboxyvinyltransferase [Chloroflexia bacterium]|nr:3-phosphoshikimate 1-carboxyvinyltransferase [Chloroflexia bacterium]